MLNNITFSVIIVSYNNLEVLIDCLNSLNKYNDIGKKLEIIIIDNSTTYEIYDYVSHKFKNIIIKKNDNKGFGEANNTGAKIAKGKHLLFLNPDTILIEPIFEFAIQKFEEEKKLALFGLKLLDKNLSRNISFHFLDKSGFFYTQTIKMLNILDIYIDGKMFILGADMFIRKDVFTEVNGFDDEIFMYNEEADITNRIKKLGYKTDYFNEKRIIHLEGRSSSDRIKSYEKRLDSLFYYCDKYNKNFKKEITTEIKYENLKLIAYSIVNNEKKGLTKKKIELLNSYLR